MTLDELISSLSHVGVCDAKEEAYLILERLFGVSKAKILLDREKNYESDEIEQIIGQRAKKIPLQYIFGEWYFMDISLSVTPDCLIPRADTEILVYEAKRLLKNGGRVADLCTGSGCIGLSMLNSRADISKMTLVDISNSALAVASKNAHDLGLESRCELLSLDITKEMPDGIFDMIVSNPPYIPSEDIDDLSDEVKNEPLLALDGGEDGLDIVRSLIDKAPASLTRGGYLLIEFGFDQGHKIKDIMDKKLLLGEYESYKILKDYGGNDRVLVAVTKNE